MGTEPRSVVYVSHQTGLGGAEHSLLDLFVGLDRDAVTPYLITSDDGPLAQAARQREVAVEFVPMRYSSRPKKLVGLWRAARQLRDRLVRGPADIVHANTLIAGYVSLLAGRRAGVPCVWHIRDMSYPNLARRVAGRADLLIANSQATSATLAGEVRDPDRLRVIYNGIDETFFAGDHDCRALRTELGIPDDALLVGMVGRLDRWKGQHVLLRAARLASVPSTRAIHVVIAGGDPFAPAQPSGYAGDLAALTAQLGIASNVHWLGHRGDPETVLAGLDIVVHPSTEPEPFGRTIAEAQALGKPVIASACGGIPEIIDDHRNGLLVPPGDTAALASAIVELLGDPALARRLGRRARGNASQRFTAKAHADAVTSCYRELAEPARTA